MPISTARPPLTFSSTTPWTVMLERKAFSTSSQIFIFSARSRDSRTLPFWSSRFSRSTSTTSATATPTLPSGLLNSSMLTVPEPL